MKKLSDAIGATGSKVVGIRLLILSFIYKIYYRYCISECIIMAFKNKYIWIGYSELK